MIQGNAITTTPENTGLPLPTTDGLVAYYPLTGTAEDKYGSYDGTENGGLTYVDDVDMGSVASFDGVNDYIDLSSMLTPNNTTTISMWVQTGTKGAVLHNNDGSGSTWYTFEDFMLYIRTDADICVYGNDNNTGTGAGGNNGLPVPTLSAVDNGAAYQHIVVITDLHYSAEVYMNGVNCGTTHLASDVITSNNAVLSIGSNSRNRYATWLTRGYYDTNVSNLRIYNRALTQQEITDIYNYELVNNYVPVNEGLVAYYPLEKNSMDNWYNQYDGTDTGVVYDGTSCSFDGVNDSIVCPATGQFECISFWFNSNSETTSSTVSNEIMTVVSADIGKIALGSTTGFFTDETLSFGNNTSDDYNYIKDNIPNGWNHVVLQWEVNKYQFYVNSDAKTMYTNVQATVRNNMNIILGRRSTAYYTGSLANTRVYDRTITQEEITGIYELEKPKFGL